MQRLLFRRVPLARPLLPAIAVASLILLLGAQRASAQPLFPDLDRERYQSPQFFAIALRGGPYYPDVDDEFSGPLQERPHHRYFGGKKRLLFAADFEVQFLRNMGTLAFGASIGYTKESAASFVDPSSAMGETDVRSAADRTSLTIIPTSASLIYRFDIPSRRYGIPLVPYGKVGLDYAVWSISNSNGDVATVGSSRGRGGTSGWHVAAGLALQLDFFDPGAAREFDAETGVNHSYLIAEYGIYRLNGLSGGDKLRLSDETWSVGLLFEF